MTLPKASSWLARLKPALVIAWIAVIGAGIGTLAKHDVTPGERAVTELAWPATGILKAPAGTPAIVITVHPECPCSRASLAELSKVLDRPHRPVSVFVVFVELSEPASATALWKQASAMPGVTLIRDPGGSIADRFGAKTSGQTFFYDGTGALRFSGGVTPSRGHQGANVGIAAIEAALNNDQPATLAASVPAATTPAFGCSLR